MSTLSLTFTPMAANATVWFANAAAFNDWVASISITLSASDLPSATTSTYGAVKMAAKVDLAGYAQPLINSIIINSDQNGDGVDETYYVPQTEDVNRLRTRVIDIDAALVSLIAKLKSAGIVSDV